MPNYIGSIFLAALLMQIVPARADPCSAYVDAMVKFEHTPHIAEITPGEQTGNGHFGLASKKIFTGDALYELRNGTWKKTSTNGDAQESVFRESSGKYTQSCRDEGTEAVAGDNAEIISTHGESTDAGPEPVSTDERIWISLTSGLLLKAENKFSITNPGGDVASIKYATAFKYDDVQAPDM